jgi:hypothetical protein
MQLYVTCQVSLKCYGQPGRTHYLHLTMTFFHVCVCVFVCVAYQIIHHESTGEGTMYGAVYRKQIGSTVETINTSLIQTV